MGIAPDNFKLTDVLAALSLATDLANGNPPETALATSYLAVELAREIGANEQAQADAFYSALLRYIGCTSFAHEEAALFGGDDIAVRRLYAPLDLAKPNEVLPATLTKLGRKSGRRVRSVATALAGAAGIFQNMAAAHCEVAVRLSTRLGLGPGVSHSLQHMFERWDGKGGPRRLSGEAIPLAARAMHVATVAQLHFQTGGQTAAREVVRQRGGTQFDPSLARAFAEHSPRWFGDIEARSAWEVALAAEPNTRPGLTLSRLDEIAAAFADFVDLKSVFWLGHSTTVAALADSASEMLGLSEDSRAATRRAALLHDLGTVSVPTGVWEKPGALTAAEWERVRLHAHYTERILIRSPLLAPMASIAGAHHERLDGSGYHRNIPGALLTLPSRIVAAADFFQALREARPHRSSLSSEAAARVLEREVAAGHLDSEAVRAVLQAAGERSAKVQRQWPSSLTDREAEVLGWLAQGHSNKAIARQLGISARTVQHHVLHVYEKISVSTRAAAALFAIENNLLRPPS